MDLIESGGGTGPMMPGNLNNVLFNGANSSRLNLEDEKF
jgi:hypothetical protein